jgi:hypothetical protein
MVNFREDFGRSKDDDVLASLRLEVKSLFESATATSSQETPTFDSAKADFFFKD